MPSKRKLTIEMVPATSYYDNIRAHVRPKVWDLLRRYTYLTADWQCEICGGIGHRHPVECHEVWRYNERTHTQRLERLIALCPKCHRCKHIGLARHMGRMRECIRHLMDVNNISRKEAWAYVKRAYATWERRSRHNWHLDISVLPEILKKAEAALQEGRIRLVPPKSASRKKVVQTKDSKKVSHIAKKMGQPQQPMALRNPKRGKRLHSRDNGKSA